MLTVLEAERANVRNGQHWPQLTARIIVAAYLHPWSAPQRITGDERSASVAANGPVLQRHMDMAAAAASATMNQYAPTRWRRYLSTLERYDRMTDALRQQVYDVLSQQVSR